MEKIKMIMVTDFSTRFHQIGLYVVIAMLIGAIAGGFVTKKLIDWKLTNAVTYRAVQIDGKEYELKERL